MTPALATISGADLFGLVVSVIVCAYLIYALLRGERF
jgi:K+-transporting ATPase KdpF subunit